MFIIEKTEVPERMVTLWDTKKVPEAESLEVIDAIGKTWGAGAPLRSLADMPGRRLGAMWRTPESQSALGPQGGAHKESRKQT